MTEPTDPMTLLREAATQAHELFATYKEAGFTEQQALYLVGQMVRGASQQVIGEQ